MNNTAQFISYKQTGYFSKMVTDYIAGEEKLRPFFNHPVTKDGIKAAIEKRISFPTDRQLLVEILSRQYQDVELNGRQKHYLQQLSSDNTFTICTAHQPNIFTGYLYFIFKILHIIKLAEELQIEIPEQNFVPVYYMGSEDADLDELGHVFINGEKFEWATKQTGAVGRMKVDKALIQLIETVSGQLLVFPFGAEIIALMKQCYKEQVTIEQATFKLVNELFAAYGLLILLPDSDLVKRAFIPVIKKELTTRFSNKAVEKTVSQFPAVYKAQASGREINLFYLLDNKRERIEQSGETFLIINTTLKFTLQQLLQELNDHPERFSPNVILRPVLQEFILPGIAFIGGGGEIAYWLELKKVFEAVEVPYPMLIVRNSFMFVNKESQGIVEKLKLDYVGLFKPALEQLNQLVQRDSVVQLDLEKEKQQLTELYEQLKNISGSIDVTLKTHTSALFTQALNKINALEKKMLSAERKKFEAQQRQLQKLRKELFPNNNLQERVVNIMPFYAAWGKNFIEMIFDNSKGLNQEFGIILE